LHDRKVSLQHTKAFQPLFNQHGASRADVHTVATSSRLDAIRSVYGVSVARSLIKIENSDNNPSSSVFKMDGFISDSNYVAKKITMVLFINGMYYNVILIIVMYFYAALEFTLQLSQLCFSSLAFESSVLEQTLVSLPLIERLLTINIGMCVAFKYNIEWDLL
jgi:hypothetical protein